MPTASIGIATVSFDIDYPNISGEIELDIPGKIPKVGGKKIKLDSFSISLQNPSVTLSIPAEFFDGSITVALDTTHCEVQVSGKVKLDVIVHKFHWRIGPASIPYMTPFSLPEPSWSVNPTLLDKTALQSSINNASQSQKTQGQGPSPQNDDAIKAELTALFAFCGAASFIDDLIDAAKTLDQTFSLATQARTANSRSMAADASSSGVVIGFGFGTGDGVIVGGSGSAGLFFTASGDYGCYGSAGVGIGVIYELSGGATAFLYWADGGQSALECFEGANFFISLDGGEVVGGGGTLSWPMNSFGGKVIANNPCGIAIVLGLAVGFPINFMSGNSQTWVDVDPGSEADIKQP